MNRYVKQFLHRGLLFGGFGPLIVAVIYLILHHTINGFSLTGSEVFCAVLSIYGLAFVHAGVSVFNQIEHWSVMKSLFWHFSTLYVAYLACYLINDWIPFDWNVVLIFTAIFVAGYFVVWGIVVAAIKAAEKRMNRQLTQ